MIVVYDSWTGKTKFIAKAIGKRIGAKVYKISDRNIPASDLYLVGCPTHFGPTWRMKRWLKKREPPVIATFTTYSIGGDIGRILAGMTLDIMGTYAPFYIGAFKCRKKQDVKDAEQWAGDIVHKFLAMRYRNKRVGSELSYLD